MKAFVTGATGFVGKNLVQKLLNEDWQVTVLVTNKKESAKIFKNKKIKIVEGDLTNQKSIKNKISADVVFNLAGVLPHHKAKESVYFAVNRDGVKNLLEEVKGKKIKRFVHISTVGIYGSQNTIIRENSSLKLNTAYEKSKYEGEKLVKDYFKKYKTPVSIIKPTIAFGPGDIRPGFKDLFKLIYQNKFVTVGNGKNHFHTIYIENLTDAIIKASKSKSAIGKDFIIGDIPCPKMDEIVNTIAEVENKNLFPVKMPLFIALVLGKIGDYLKILNIPFPLDTQRVKFITNERKYSTKKAEKILKWKPKVEFKDAIEKTYLWYKENNYL